MLSVCRNSLESCTDVANCMLLKLAVDTDNWVFCGTCRFSS